jgi:oligopeptide transport system substrate-binding protein
MPKRAVLLAVALITACASGFAAADAPAAREFVLADLPQGLSLDPLHTYTSFESQFYTAIYEGLVVPDPRSLEPLPGVATSWEASAGGTVWKFSLRTDARYSNGDRVRAQDFVATWLRMLDPANAAEYSVLFDVIKGARDYRTGAIKDPSKVGIRALSDDVLEVRLERPAAHFLKLLTHISFLPLHPSLLKAADWNNATTVIGNGPYTMKSRTAAEILLEKNPRYWDAANVAVERIRIRFMESDSQGDATDGYITGKYQWVTQGLIQYDKLEAQDKLEAFPMFGTTYFYFACDRAPWSDWRVRRALALLVPWDKVRAKEQFIFPTSSLVPAIPGYPEVKGIETPQLEEATKLLSDAGFPGGKGLPVLTVLVEKDSTGVKAIVQKMADAWKAAIGFSVQFKEVEPGTYLAATRTRDYGMAISTWIGDYADPLTFLQLWTTGSNLNDARVSDPEYDAAVDAAIGIVDSDARYKKLAEAERLLLSKAALLPLDHKAALNLIDTASIDGWFSNPLDLHPFKFIKFKARKSPPEIAMDIR